MADFDKVVRKHMNDEGTIPADSVPALVQSISKYVGENFVSVDRYNTKKTLADELQTKLDESSDIQGKYDKLKTEYDAYKNEQEAKEVRVQKQDAYKDILKSLNIPEKRWAAILKTVAFDELKITDGKLDDVEKLTKEAKEEWADFIVSTKETGVQSANPPANNGGKSVQTKEEIMAIKDTTARQKAIAENHELFGF
jgi:hypothetical protein